MFINNIYNNNNCIYDRDLDYNKLASIPESIGSLTSLNDL